MKYFYMTWVIIMAFIWLYFYIKNNAKKEIAFISVVFGLAGPIGESIHVLDWWKPATITGTLIGFEDFLMGFFIGGIAAVSYNGLFHKKIKGTINSKRLFTMIILLTSIFFSTYFMGFHSFYSCVFGCTIVTSYILFNRKDLVHKSIYSGLIMLSLGAAAFLILSFLFPGFIHEYWFLPNHWFSLLVSGIPVAEYIWFFQIGMFIGSLYEYCLEQSDSQVSLQFSKLPHN